ncbi:hypothetical protein [Ramlibacter albus]|uniref:Uncharacterized protein n=1 Tax=Ramlibacter albus TaxID=2079448 RepID=A0A923M9B9_9BURK|nr:hypothetical protein [Ramlibacter albus]MBC5766203.1 hypothetical protein [Ramlibacter albus]
MEPVYHVILEGRQVGPYDRRTIVGMRIKNTLTSGHELLTPEGQRLTVADLVKLRPRDNSFNPMRSGSFSIVQATYSASLLKVEGRGHDIPSFKDEIEARVQQDVLRMAGRFRAGFGWKEDRIKLPLKDVVHARVRNSIVELWLRSDGQDKLQKLTLELFTHEAAGEFVEWLPNATPWPEADSQPAPLTPSPNRGLMIAASAAVVVVIVVVAVLAMAKRVA